MSDYDKKLLENFEEGVLDINADGNNMRNIPYKQKQAFYEASKVALIKYIEHLEGDE